jgi:hypothetical protein
MKGFLFDIGIYNVIGSILLVFLLSEKHAEKVLGTWLQLLAVPYSHGEHGRMWIWWALSTNVALGALMVLASRWPVAIQREVTIVVIVAYAIMLAVNLAAMRSPRYRRKGLWANVVLWVAQIGWGAYGLVVTAS